MMYEWLDKVVSDVVPGDTSLVNRNSSKSMSRMGKGFSFLMYKTQ